MPFIASLFIALSTSFGSYEGLAESPSIPIDWPSNDRSVTEFALEDNESRRKTTIDPLIQHGLTRYIANHATPVAAAVVVDVKTGKVLAMAQGRPPKKWSANAHSTIHAQFPAASLFKTIVAAAAIELIGADPNELIGLSGGCANVRPTGIWLQDRVRGRRQRMSLKRAYGASCNGYFAKLAVNSLGLNAVRAYAERLGWGREVPADFATIPSPMQSPKIRASSVHAVGRYAAGFGYVGTSAVHAAWQMLAIARDGDAIPLRLLDDQSGVDPAANLAAKPLRVMEPSTATQLRKIMKATIRGGTASFAFRSRRYRGLRNNVGGKTGTLTGHAPDGVTTWFAGLMPVDNPEVVVAAVVVLEDLWHIKGPNLAAEGFALFRDAKRRGPLQPVSQSEATAIPTGG